MRTSLLQMGWMSRGMVTREGSASGQPSIAATVRSSTALNGVDTNGWVVDVTFPGAALGQAVDATKLAITAQDTGYDTTGATVVRTRTITGTLPLRKPWPNQLSNAISASGSDAVVSIVPDDYIYSTTTIVSGSVATGAYGSSVGASLAITNNSTRAYPRPHCCWVTPPHLRSTGTLHVEFSAWHAHAKNKSQVACVKFYGRNAGGGYTLLATVSTMMQSTFLTGGKPVPVYAADLNTSGLAAGDAYIKAIAYPWDGPTTYDTTVNGEAIVNSTGDSTANNTVQMSGNTASELHFYNDPASAYGAAYAVVDAAAGNDATGTAAATEAGSSPFLTLQAAGAALKTFINTTYGHNDAGNGIIAMKAGTYSGFTANMISLTMGSVWLTFQRHSSAAAGSVTLQTGTVKVPPRRAKFSGIKITANATGSGNIVIDGGGNDNASLGVPNYELWFDDCDLTQFDYSSILFYRIGLMWLTNCRTDKLRIGQDNVRSSIVLLGGSTVTGSQSQICPFNTLGSRFTNGATIADMSTSWISLPDAPIMAFNSFTGTPTSPASGAILGRGGGSVSQGQAVNGMVLAQNLIESSSSNWKCVQLAADGSLGALRNVVVQNNTCVGGRFNWQYNDSGSTAIPRDGVEVNNLTYEHNIKVETYAAGTESSTRVGNWEPSYHIGSHGNFNMVGSASGTAFGPGAIGSGGTTTGMRFAGTWAGGIPAFTDDKSFEVGSTVGGGIYVPTNSSIVRNLVAAGKQTVPFDLNGTAWLNDGTDAAGAYRQAI